MDRDEFLKLLVDSDMAQRIRDLFNTVYPVDITYDNEGHLVVGVIDKGVEYAFHLVDQRNVN